MENLMHLLLEALRANFGDRNNESLEDQQLDELSGFILENVHVATMPYIESEEEEEPPNPLRRLIDNRQRPRGGSNPQIIHKILDHIVRLEKKVKVLERCIPPKPYQQRIWLGATEVMDGEDYDESGYDPDEGGEGSMEKRHSSSRKSSKGPPSSKSPHSSLKAEPSRMASRPVRLEKEERSCLAKLLFSRCWMGKDHGAGWKIKRRPTGHKGSLSCPCGQIGPCAKVKGRAVPIDKIKSTKKATNSSSAGSKISPKTTDGKNKKKTVPSHLKVANPSSGKPLCEKLFPCCFKDHYHNDCCCRCKDNPPLTVHRKSKEGMQKTNVPMKRSTRSSATEKASHKTAENSGIASEAAGDEEDSDYYDNQSEYQTFNVRSISQLSPDSVEKLNHLSRKRATGDMRVKSKRQDSRCAELQSHRRETDVELSKKSVKSTTSFQIVLHPDISNDETVEPEVVSHQILKTLSTIHGPVKVEQKIVVQGAENSVIIVTHGEACQCNLCNMLKGKMHPREFVEGLSPRVVKISTDSGCNTLINHSDGCTCDLCRVLDPAVIKTMEHRAPQIENESIVMAACSKSNENNKNNSEETPPNQHSASTEAKLDTPECCMMRTSSRMKKSKCKTKTGKKKTKKCRCTKCRQRRRVEKLKLRLKKEMGTEEYNKILREILHCSDEKDPKSSAQRKPSVQSDSDDNGYVEPKRTKKSVSFHGGVDHLHQEELQAYGSNAKGCKLCKLLNMTEKQPSAMFTKDKDTTKSRHSQNHNSTVYNVNASSHEIPCSCQLKSKFNSNEAGMFHFKSEEQKCFPPGHIPKKSRENQSSSEKEMKEEITKEFSYFEADNGTNDAIHGSSCPGRRRRESPREEATGRPAILLQEGAFPQKFVYWAPGSRSNMATAYSSDSYYVPDQDEFPIVNVECDESTPSSGRNTGSGGGPVQRMQIPVWFRMYPDRNTR